MVGFLSGAVLVGLVAVDRPAASSDASKTTPAAAVNAELLLRGINPADRLPWVQAARQRIEEDTADRARIAPVFDRAAVWPSSEQMGRGMEQIAAGLPDGSRPLADRLADWGTDPASLRTAIRWKLATDRYVAERVTDEAIRTEFAAHPAWYDGTAATARQTIAATEAAARDADPDGERFVVRGLTSMPRDVAATTLDASVGETIGPIRSPLGWHRLVIEEVSPGQRPLEDARPAVIAELRRRLLADLQR